MSAKRRFLTAIMVGFRPVDPPQRKPVGNVVSIACVELIKAASA